MPRSRPRAQQKRQHTTTASISWRTVHSTYLRGISICLLESRFERFGGRVATVVSIDWTSIAPTLTHWRALCCALSHYFQNAANFSYLHCTLAYLILQFAATTLTECKSIPFQAGACPVFEWCCQFCRLDGILARPMSFLNLV